MATAISRVPTAELIARGAAPDCDADARYEADWELIRRWRAGLDLPHLIALMRSDSTSGRSRAAFLVEEVATAHEALCEAVVRLADDPLADCRRAFVKFVSETRLYNATVAAGLAECLRDTDLTVRLFSILWAIDASAASLDHIRRLIEADVDRCEPPRTGTQGEWREGRRLVDFLRASRALDIAWRVRSGECIRDIGSTVTEEDSFVLVGLERFLRLRQDRRRIPSAAQSPTDG